MNRVLQNTSLIILLSLSLFASSNAQVSKDEIITSGLDYMYHLKFDSAKIKFDELKRQNPKDPTGYFFLSLLEWWKINIDKKSDANDENFVNSIDEVERVANDALDENEDDYNALFFKGGALGYKGLVMSFRNNWIKAAENGREALNLLKDATEVNPANKDGIFGVGIYNYFAEYIPDRYPMLKPLMILFPDGDKAKGLLQIKESAVNSKYAKTEAKYILAYLYLRYEKNYEQSELYSKELFEKYPENPVFERYLYNSYVGLNKWQDALNGWKTIIMKADSNRLGYNIPALTREANYYTALSLSKMGRILEAEPYLLKAEEISQSIDTEDTAFKAFIYILMGMLNHAKGNKEMAASYYNKVLAMENFQDSHKEAENLKARL